MQVVEIFTSINGESKRAGELAVFVRFKGCNLCCSYCDTAWANEADAKFSEMTPEEILEHVKNTEVKNVTLTGGEPLLQNDIEKLVEMLIDAGLRVEIETNGSVNVNEKSWAKRPSFTLDYKSISSGQSGKMCMENFAGVTESDVVKFVVGSREDLDDAYRVIKEYALDQKCGVFLSPVFGKIEPADMVDYMIQKKMNDVRLQIQMHKVIWDPDKRGV